MCLCFVLGHVEADDNADECVMLEHIKTDGVIVCCVTECWD